MPLTAGTKLGPYEILSPLGAGGMGEVYKAKDTRLDRTVAIKVLPSHLSDNARLKERFEREARAVSSLNHPHICTLFDIGSENGVDFMVMEHIEGETLADRLKKGALPLDQALRHAIEIADALDKAHRQGVVHRDLKPGNIMLTKSGAKLLDFGLAKRSEPAGFAADSELPTRQEELTREGALLGTLQYMSPEQLEGKEADSRTDIFAFGAVLYEMLTAEKAFQGESQASLIAAIIEKSPRPLKSVRPALPANLEWLVGRCVAKDPSERWQDAHDLKLCLEQALSEWPEAKEDGSVLRRRGSREIYAYAVAAGAVLLAVVVAALMRAPPQQPAMLQTFEVSHPDDGVFATGEAPALSPDGRHLAVVVTAASGRTALWIRPLGESDAHPLPGTEGATFPFWSPDSRFLGFFADGQLKKVDIAGGPPQALAPATDTRGGAWSSEGVILFSPNLDAPLYRVSDQGGAVTPVTSLDRSRQEFSHRLPSFLPDGRGFLFVIQSGTTENAGLAMGSLDAEPVQRIGNIQSKAVYAEPGYLLYAAERTLVARRFDPDSLELIGDPYPVGENVGGRVGIFAEKAFSLSRTGILAHWSGGSLLTELAWFDRNGTKLESVGELGQYDSLSLSPDGTRVAYERWDTPDGRIAIWIHDLARNVNSPFARRNDGAPVWSPDGQAIAFGSIRRGSGDLYRMAARGGDTEELLLESEDFLLPSGWSADGRFLVFVNISSSDVGILLVSAPGEAKLLLQSEFVEKDGRPSPDGQWLAYTSNESGAWEVRLQSFPDGEDRMQVSTGGGSHPEWRADGKELFYLAADRRLMSVVFNSESSNNPSPPQALFRSRVVGHVFKRIYAVNGDGTKFLMIVPPEGESSSPMTVTVNWASELPP